MIDFWDFGARKEYATYLSHTVTEFVGMVEDNNQIRLVNYSGQMDCKIHHLSLNFEAYNEQTIDGARNMILGMLNTFLYAINHGCDNRLAPYLCPYPFTPDNVDIRIHFVGDCLYNYPLPFSIQYAVYSVGEIGYYRQNACGLTQIRTESLDLALSLAQSPALINCPTYAVPCLPETFSQYWRRLRWESARNSYIFCP